MTASEEHDEILSALLGVMNEFEQRGVDIGTVAHGALCAAAYYAVYSIQTDGTPVNDRAVTHTGMQFEYRMREYNRQQREGTPTPPGDARAF